MPTQLSGVSVTVNGKPAFIYYVSATQINVLTPLDSTTGAVQIVVTVGGVSSALFSVTMSVTTPSLLRFGASNSILATHIDYTLVGPATMSVPGYPVSPARPGETITLWGVGFGVPSNGVVNGSSSQSGTLTGRPTINIGGIDAAVTFAGLVSPGLHQINVTVPNSAATGDAGVTCSWNGWIGVAEGSIAVQR